MSATKSKRRTSSRRTATRKRPAVKALLRRDLNAALLKLVERVQNQARIADADSWLDRGFKPDTKEHGDCLASLDSQRDARMQRRHQELVERPSTPDRR